MYSIYFLSKAILLLCLNLNNDKELYKLSIAYDELITDIFNCEFTNKLIIYISR